MNPHNVFQTNKPRDFTITQITSSRKIKQRPVVVIERSWDLVTNLQSTFTFQHTAVITIRVYSINPENLCGEE